ncbi:aminopeptidase [Hydrogenophaga crassostreae]|uniref:Aminopeptidase n=1 Tax=Hydrogenophaga crassostreae TaxID=1763535 RepID=A0A162VWK1_9BURK|nr:aminopeptidase [Hydrogenophaga crassostreae]AOW12077.1 aminopeptidase [Hydrogenophaga crassostreae]OAD41021.1 aminopeptidase [Hydrogenophaga crassostreae]
MSLRTVRMAGLLLAALVLSACASSSHGMGYYWQSVSGHLKLMHAARPIDDWLADAQTPEALRKRLLLAQRIRAFASSELQLPDNDSYRRYADLHRKAAVYNVVAAPPLSLKLNQWCFPVVGCVGYRGYFDEGDARTFASSLPSELEVAVYPVPAYSTLGWTNWAGGDPLLNTFIGYPEGELARLIFHELAHQVVYVSGDTAFNESFATAVERLGGERWLAQSTGTARTQYQAFESRRRAFRELTRRTRDRLRTIYEDPARSDEAKRADKAGVMSEFHIQFATLRDQWSGFKGYDKWVAQANNASFGAQAAYDDWVPAFEALFQREGQSFDRFFEAVRQLANETPDKRLNQLRALSPASTASSH